MYIGCESCLAVWLYQGDKQMRIPLDDDYKAEELLTDVGGNAEGPEEVLTVDEYLMPMRWNEDEKKSDEVFSRCSQLSLNTSWLTCCHQSSVSKHYQMYQV